jgi:hypothetical protein
MSAFPSLLAATPLMGASAAPLTVTDTDGPLGPV